MAQALGKAASKPTELAEIIREIIREELGTRSNSQGERRSRVRSRSRLVRRTDIEHKGETLSRDTKAVEPVKTDETWATILGRKARRELKKPVVPRSTGKNPRVLLSQKPPMEIKKKRPPRTAVVQIATEGDTTYADTLRKAKERIKLDELGIPELRPRRAKTGAFLLEISGPDSAVKADALAMKLQETFAENGEIKISRPVKTTEIRIDNLDDSISSMEVLQTIVTATECNHADVKMGPINKARWTTAKVTLLPDRGLQCFKCLRFGHIKAECRSTTDRSIACYRCGEEGHQARGCTKAVKCLICEEAGLPHGHRMGGNACHPETGRKNKNRAQNNQLADRTGKQKEKTLEAGQQNTTEEKMGKVIAANSPTPMETETLHEQHETSELSPTEWPKGDEPGVTD
ncbi:PREDICTED: uncharacterized protein LOC108769209 [Trachymyrmex cornetzi]|uniref:uncharacterized protein LOC108769209 n=1 Tax=Trachymyrmex cornetzi TaxID=471704 RepID=UPI00084F50C8|nr:PREDICTED: uncharacterized protein LOC108769209 [Trachymyrmex cornetzi]